MTQQSAKAPLSFAANGTKRPVHQDRQVLRAGDLTLEQTAQDAMLARARRYLHGWGIVGGLVPQVGGNGVITITPGYGVTPTGAELWLPQPAVLAGVAAALSTCCGPGPGGCEGVDAAGAAAASTTVPTTPVTGWLVARPASIEAEPRAGVPQDCAHPASTLLPSRRCGGVDFVILCELPPTHQPVEPDCENISPFVCGTPNGPVQPLPWEPPAGVDDDFLVIAQLTAVGGSLVADPSSRRQLWPAALIQAWITACLCGRPPSYGAGGASFGIGLDLI
jgi:hypothetical protein